MTTKRRAAKHPGGRPAVEGEARSEYLRVRITKDARAEAEALAEARGVDVSTLVRSLLAAAAGRTEATPAAAPARPVDAPAAREATPTASRPARRSSSATRPSNRPKRGR